ncbi:GD10157 [Drosophila simulans]|uniref:GD10157 n=1 Tax=Drosophila simulans TaxID=7240 RepID=B4QFT9_DROSI|nr:GD10157 [Drosophila simulans]
MLFTIALVGAVLALAYSLHIKIFSYWKRKGVPHEKPLPIVGNMKGVVKKCHFRDINQRIYEKFKGQGPIAGMYMFFKRTALITDLDFIKQVMIKDFSYFQDRGAFNNPRDDPLTGHLFALEGEEWRAMRHKLSPVFTSGKIKQMSKVIVDVGLRLGDAMDKAVKEAKVEDGNVEVKDLCARFTTDVIGSCAFGLECNSLQDPSAEFRQKGREIFTRRRYSTVVQSFILTNAKLARKLRMKVLPDDLTQFFMSTVKNTVEYRLKNGIKRNDFIEQMIELRAEDQEAAKKGQGIDLSHGLTLEQMAAQAFVFFVAGFETSSSTMSLCLYELAVQPEIQQRLREEIESVLANVDGGELNYDVLAQMTYLDQVLSETLRKHPLLPHLIRETNKDYQIPNTDIVLDKGVLALIPVHNIHHDPEIYPEPEKFDPSRFDPEEVKNRHPMAYLPFGDGPRNCIGLRFGKIQAKIGLVSLLRRFKFSVSNRTEVPLIFSKKSFLLATDNGIYLKVESV